MRIYAFNDKMDYSSASEGEIVERNEGTKATTTKPHSKNGDVNGDDRPRSLASRSSRPQGSRNADDLDYDDGYRYRDSRDRNSGQSSARGQKRGYPEDSYHDRTTSDTRRFKVRYEDDSYDRAPRGAKDSRYERDHRARERGYPGGQGFTESKGQRDGRRSSTDSNAHLDDNQGRAGLDHAERQGQRPQTGQHAKVRRDAGSISIKEPEPESAPVVDEAALIEERRKRREALRAKHKPQETLLLHKALHVNTTAEDSSNPQSSREVSPTISSPATPQAASPGSPAVFAVTDDSELANQVHDTDAFDNAGEDGPSAADYDPSMDREDRLREQRALQASESSAGAYDETKDDDRAVMVPKAPVEDLKPKEFDMFAEDDEDDMFAPENDTKAHKKEDGTQAVHMPQAKQLDRSMLDDWDDPEGYYRIILGELLDNRYHVQTNLGKGVFSAVVRAHDRETDKPVAIKVIRKQESMYKAGVKEIEILQQLVEADPEDKKHVIRLERHFEHKGHLCMVFENLSINLREVLKKFGRDIGINIKAVRAYAQQIFLGLLLLKKCELLHADLKPDNILVNESRSSLKIADLGSAIHIDDNEITDMLVSRFYRSPEIMLGIKGDYALDMWSIGCTLYEMYTGKILFTGGSNNQMLKAIIECRGKIPNRLIKRSIYWPQHFEPDGTFLSQEYDSVTRKEVVRKLNMTRTVPAKELRTRLFANNKGLSTAEAKELNLFADLLDKCLQVDPARRISPNDALKHGFISRSTANVK